MYKSGVYEIVNLATCKKYIGSSKNVELRLRQHYLLLKRGVHYNKHLQNSFNKYNENAFIFRVIEYCQKETRVDIEKEYVEKHNCLNDYFGYNIREPNMVSMAEETKKKISESMKGVNTWTKGVKVPKSVLDKRTLAQRGLKRSDIAKKRYSDSKIGQKNSMAKLTEKDVLEIIKLRNSTGLSYGKLGKIFFVSRSTISSIFNGHTWTCITNK